MSAELVERFYAAFSERDHAGMAACYHPEVHFSDPVFPDLHGPMAAAMWRMLCERGTDLRLEASAITDTSAHWEAWYTFSATGNAVHNVIDASFEFRDGLIVRHVDVFDFYAWARQALGVTGVLLGWTPMVKNKVRSQAGRQLEKFAAKA